MFVREIRDGGAKARVLCVRERETVVGKGSGSRGGVCVSMREREETIVGVV